MFTCTSSTSAGKVAAVHGVIGTGDEGRGVARQPGHELGDFLGPAQSLQGVLSGQKVQSRLIEVPLEQWRQNEAWSDGVDPHAVRRMLPGCGLGDADHAMLGGDVGAGHSETDLTQDRGHVDHRPASVAFHGADSGTLGVEDAVEVDPDDLVPGGIAVLRRRLGSPPMPALATTTSTRPNTLATSSIAASTR